MSLSQVGINIKQSVTLHLNATAKQLKDAGEPVIHLGGGEPKSLVPEGAINASLNYLAKREVRYSPAGGLPELKDEIIRYTEHFYNQTGIERQNVIVSGGAKQSIMVALKALLDPGDEVIIPVPYWVSYPEMVRICKGVPIFVDCDETFNPILKNIAAAVTPKTKAIIINSPNNPTGVMYNDEFIKSIVEFCENEKIDLIMDDIYHRLVFDDKKIVSCFNYVKQLDGDSRLIVINGVSKMYAMTGFRIGWAIGNKTLIKVMTNIQGHETSGASTLSQYAAIGALTGDQSCVNDLNKFLENNRNVLVDGLNSIKNINVTKPDGTFYAFVDFRKYEQDSTKLSKLFLEKIQVVTVPGIDFGMEGFLRISTCNSESDIREGIRRIKWLLEDDQPNTIEIGNKIISKE